MQCTIPSVSMKFFSVYNTTTQHMQMITIGRHLQMPQNFNLALGKLFRPTNKIGMLLTNKATLVFQKLLSPCLNNS